jgi:hypothetical protein
MCDEDAICVGSSFREQIDARVPKRRTGTTCATILQRAAEKLVAIIAKADSTFIKKVEKWRK